MAELSPCGRCRGRGELRPIGLQVEMVRCPDCDGTGIRKAKPATLRPTEQTQKPRAISPAAPEQRRKVRIGGVCRNCGADRRILPIDPAHVTDRGEGGCDHELCVIPLCRVCHRRFEVHELDILPLLSFEEQGHAVAHVGAVSFLQAATGEKWWPESARSAA